MNWDAIGALSELLGALAVVLTLIYLSIQIRQNTTSVKASAHQTWIAANIAEQSSAQQGDMSQTISTGLFNPENLTESNWVQFSSYCHLMLMKAESSYYLRKDKIVDDSVFEKELDRAANFLRTKGPAQWWSAGARTQFTDEFVGMIEGRLSLPSDFQVYDFTPGQGFHPHTS